MEPIGHAVKLFHLPGFVSFCAFEDLDPLQGKSVGLICRIKAKHQYFIMMAHVRIISKVICVHNLDFTTEGQQSQSIV